MLLIIDTSRKDAMLRYFSLEGKIALPPPEYQGRDIIVNFFGMNVIFALPQDPMLRLAISQA